ncbi:PAS domain-containing protein, partial [Pseudonocardia pini]|uniref:PAS domain-containing protein n=1 Tax=Pseudonocardia pini TaxID=2758030 RepID=UPI0015F0F1F8
MLADATPTLIWVDGPDGERTFVNQAWSDYTGAGADDLGTGWRALVHPDDLERYDTRRAAATEADVGFEVEYRLRGADGRYRWVLDRGVPVAGTAGVGGGYVGGCLDIDARFREQERQRVVGVVGAAMDRAATVADRREVLVRTLVDEGLADLAGLVVTDGADAEVVAVAARDAETRELLSRIDIGSRWFADVVANGVSEVRPGDGGYLADQGADEHL